MNETIVVDSAIVPSLKMAPPIEAVLLVNVQASALSVPVSELYMAPPSEVAELPTNILLDTTKVGSSVDCEFAI